MRDRFRSAVVGLGAAAVVMGVLSGCGSGDTSTAAAAATAAPGGGTGRGLDPALVQKIDQCLQAAGLPVPSARPRPTGTPPTGTAEPGGATPSRAPGQRGFGGGQFADPKVQAALKACGITLPTRAPAAPAAGAPGAT